jgi:tetratricopeptide (TPR) repeat protein
MNQPLPIEHEVQHLRALVRDHRFVEALQAADLLLLSVPENRDVLFQLAMAQRFLGQTSEALNTLTTLERAHPRFSRLFQERGQCYIAQKQAPQAINALLTAVRINPALPISWSLLEGLYRMTAQTSSAAEAAAQLATLKNLPPEVVTATALFMDGDLAEAEQLVRAFLLQHGHHIEAMRLLARIARGQDILDDAQLLLEGVLDLAPDYHAARFDYAQVLVDRQLDEQAKQQAERLLGVDSANRNYRTLFALTCVGLGLHEQAIACYRDLLPDALQPAELHLSIAHSLKTLGRGTEAATEYQAAAQVRPGYGDAYWSLANLKTYRFTDTELQQMRAAESASTTTTADRYQLCFALGKALEDAGDYEASFRFYARGNALKHGESGYRPEAIELNTRLQIEICTPELFAKFKRAGATDPDPIFIVGLPRSGSTLIEQILASHSAVEGTHELAAVPRLVLELRGRTPDSEHPRYPAALADLSAEELRSLGQKYLAATQVYRHGKPFFIDKMPNNFRHIGLIHLMLPNAKIIDIRREPMACCFGNFKQLFARGQEFTYQLEDIARYYRTYLELMRHWDRVLPGRVLRIHYEDVVEDLETNVRRLLDYCGLGFESGCIEFHRTARNVQTASAEQVRRPIYREGLEQWRHFEPWLAPLRESLGDALSGFRQ